MRIHRLGTYPFSTTLPERQRFRAVEKGYVPSLWNGAILF
jgi:hypothetical protein